MNYQEWSHILLELALSVSGEQELRKLLRKSSRAFLSRLGSTYIGFYQWQEKSTNHMFISPRRATEDPMVQHAAKEIETALLQKPQQEMIMIENSGYFYGYRLRNFGFLIFGQSEPLSMQLMNELKPIVDMLAQNINGCLEIEKRQKMELELEKERSFLKALINAIPDIVFFKDYEGSYRLVNQAAGDLIGMPPEEIINLTDRDIHGAEEARVFQERDMAVMKSGNTYFAESNYKNTRKEMIPHETLLTPFYGQYDTIQGIIGVSRDITERKKIEAALDAKMKFQSLLMHLATNFINVSIEEMDTAIHDSLSQAGRHCDVDRAYVFEYDFDAGLMHNTHEWCKEGIEPAIDLLQNVPCKDFMAEWIEVHLKGDTVYVEDVEALPTDSSLKEILSQQGIKTLVTIPLFMEKECLGFIGFDSVTRQKQWAEDEITLLKVMAELFANAWIRKKREVDLVASRQEAEAASLAKSEFLANMSHEIRTPLNGIVSMMYLLQETNLNHEQQDYILTAKDSVDSLLSIINNILDLSKIEAGYSESEEETFDLEQELRRIMAMVSEKLQEKGLDTYIIYDEYLSRVFRGDRMRLRQILLNLVGNALKFTSEGSVGIRVREEYQEDEGSRILIDVEDTGIGIAEERQVDIFDKFAQGDASSAKKYEGAGLGLAISKKLAEMLDGQLTVKSQPGKGSVFTLNISLVPCEAQEAAEDSFFLEASASDTQEKPVERTKILLVDDHASNRNAARLILEKQGYQVTEAESGFEAIDKIQNMSVDLVLMDIQMPEMDGYETTSRIRKMGGLYSQVPIIALTANATTKDREKSMKAGMTDHITKPFKPGKLREVMQKQFISNEEDSPLETTPIFDANEFWERYEKDLTMVTLVLEAFWEDLPKHLNRLENCAVQGKLEALREEAHNLKGASAYASAKNILESAEMVMKIAMHGKMEEINKVLVQLRKQETEFVEKSSQWIRALREKKEN